MLDNYEAMEIAITYGSRATNELYCFETRVLGDFKLTPENPLFKRSRLILSLEGMVVEKSDGTAYTMTAGVKKTPSFEINKAYYNEPVTVVLWKDGTKTIVTAQPGELYDEEKGLAMAYTKKALGNEGNYYKKFSEKLPE